MSIDLFDLSGADPYAGLPAVIPASLKPGDAVALVSPASPVDPVLVEGACERLRAEGFEPVVMPHAVGAPSGSFAATGADRIADLTEALTNPRYKAVICTRGGYGAVELLPHFSPRLLRGCAKWLVGFSDISALHAMLNRAGVASIHGPMCKDISRGTDRSIGILFRLLRGDSIEPYTLPTHQLSRPGHCRGILTGGNLAVINGLASTPYDPLARASSGSVLLIEDIAEHLYKIDRVLNRLHLAGVLSALEGIVAGQFTLYEPDANYADVEHLIRARLDEWGVRCPVAFNFPVGHVPTNLPMMMGVPVELDITGSQTTLTFHPYD